jgi:Cu(I)/Ag(I) efflux system membrane protein CusA/SilA
MIDWLIATAVRRRWWFVAGALLWGVIGGWAVLHTPIDAVPDLSENQVLVYADWPGHGPEDVERNVTYPLSLLCKGIPGVRVIRGSSDVGTSTLYLIFHDNVSFPEARKRALERLAGAPRDLPAEVTPRLAAEGIPTGQIFWYTVEGPGYDLGELRALQDWSIAPQLESVPGVAEVASVGGFVRELQVRLDLPALARTGLSVRDVCDSVAAARATVGGHVIHKGNAEFVVQVDPPSSFDKVITVAVLEQLVLPTDRGAVRLGEVARVSLGAASRRGMLEKDGNEVVGGIVHLRYGHNPLDVTQAVKTRLRELQAGLSVGVRIIPCYDRTPLILGAVGTVTRTLIEAILVATVCVIVVLRHVRASLVVGLTLPLVVLGAFTGMWLLRVAGLADVQTNIMSLAGIVISIGVLVDSSIVMSENVMYQLRRRYGDRPVARDISGTVISACQSVGRPVFFSVLIMLVSFLPVFALRGIDGRMYAPLAWTKTLALISAAALAVTLVPALSAILIRGRMRDESESWIVRSVIQVYRPILSLLLDRPGPLAWILSATFVLAAAPLGQRWLLLTFLGGGMLLTGLTLRTNRWRSIGVASLVLLALVAEQGMSPLRMEMRMPLNEGMVMDMPISVPRASIAQSGDDVKARDMVLCRFPEVHMVVGKAGRADTPFDPAPLDMIETMIEFRPLDWWPRRRLLRADAEQQARTVWQALIDDKLIRVPDDAAAHPAIIGDAVDAGLLRYNAIQREVGHLRIQEFQRTLGVNLAGRLAQQVAAVLRRQQHISRPLADSDIAALQNRLPPDRVRELSLGPTEELVAELSGDVITFLKANGLLRAPVAEGADKSATEAPAAEIGPIALSPKQAQSVFDAVQDEYQYLWRKFLPELNAVASRRAAPLWTRIITEELIARTEVLDDELATVLRQAYAARYAPPPSHHHGSGADGADAHHGEMLGSSPLPLIDPHPVFDNLQQRLSGQFAASLRLEVHDPESLAGFGGEMDRALQLPGWTNVWTKPIQNRVDMLATGVNAEVGVRVLGRDLDAVVRASEDVAVVLRELPGAADVVADPIRGKGYVRITPDPVRAAELGVSLGELNDVIEAALSGRIVAHELIDRERLPIRVLATVDDAPDEQTLRRLPVPVHRPRPAINASVDAAVDTVPLDSVADVRVTEGPATIKSENGWLRNYVRLNVRDRDVLEFVDEARRVVAAQVALPPGVFVEWTGQFEHSLQARRTLMILMPIVLALILVLLYVTYRDWADALLMVLAVPGALAGGVLCQWLLGYPLSIAVGMGYIACFGMAAATGIVMLVYLREAVDRAGGLENISLPELRQAVLTGAVHRLRPKLLTEATTILGLAPMLWSTGVGAEVIRPMAAPVLGGILIADEVIDLLLPILFYHVRRWRWSRLHEASPESELSDSAPVDVAIH